VARTDWTSHLDIKSGENTRVNDYFSRLLPLAAPTIRIRAVIGVLLSAIITIPTAAQATDAGEPPSPRGTAAEIGAAILRAESAMTSEEWSVAAEAWAEVGRLDPTLAGAAYNQGVARYRSGAFESAAESFQKSAELGDANLAAQSMYNEGTARYAEALQRLNAASPGANDPTAKPALDPTADPLATPSAPADPMKETIKRVEDSLSHFRDAIDADQGNRDARVNAELAARLLRQLREVQQQQQDQQQQDQEQQDQEPQDQEPQDQEPQDQEPQNQEPQDQEPQDQEPQDQEAQDQEPQDQEPQDQEPQDQEQEAQDPATSEEEEGDSEDATAEEAPSSEEADESAEKPRMTKEEAERLLQSVRDKERQRRQEKAKKDAAGPRTPVKKDW